MRKSKKGDGPQDTHARVSRYSCHKVIPEDACSWGRAGFYLKVGVCGDVPVVGEAVVGRRQRYAAQWDVIPAPRYIDRHEHRGGANSKGQG